MSEESQIWEMFEFSAQMLGDTGCQWESARTEEKQALRKSLFSEVEFDLDTHRITAFKLKLWVEP